MWIIDRILFIVFVVTIMSSMAHDYRYTLGEKKTTFFRWTGDNFSFLLFLADAQRKAEAKRKPPRR